MPHHLTELVQRLGNTLKKREWKLVTAESCTGGGLAYHITNAPGSSAWFERGFVTYSNASKEELLNVRPESLAVFGAVSEQVAKEMAEGALQHSQAQVAIAITGIAGPDGGSVEKPVGTVWLSWAGMNMHTQTAMNIFLGDRANIREQAIQTALQKLLEFVHQ